MNRARTAIQSPLSGIEEATGIKDVKKSLVVIPEILRTDPYTRATQGSGARFGRDLRDCMRPHCALAATVVAEIYSQTALSY
jgi:hypothetical protein